MSNRSLDFFAPPSAAVAEGATTPDPGLTGATVWSTTAGRMLVWDGSAWWPAGLYSFGPEDVSGTSYTFVAADSFKLKRCSNAALVTATVPTNASVPYPIGRTQLYIMFAGAGGGAIATGGTPTFDTALNLAAIAQGAVVTLSKLDTNHWLAS